MGARYDLEYADMLSSGIFLRLRFTDNIKHSIVVDASEWLIYNGREEYLFIFAKNLWLVALFETRLGKISRRFTSWSI